MSGRHALALLPLLLLLALPGPASATFTERNAAGELVVTGGDAGNTVTVELVNGEYMVTDTTDDMGAGDNCSKPTPSSHTAMCDAAPVAKFTVNLDKGNDKFASTAPIPLKVTGGAGNDNLTGGPMGDTLIGETSPDDPGTGQNEMDGGGGNDDVFGGGGADIVKGGPGDDGVAGAGGDDVVQGGDGSDSVIGGPGNDMMLGDAGNDFLYPGAGPANGVGDGDTMSGGDGIDEVTYASRTTRVVVKMDGVANDGLDGENDNVLGDVEKVTGGTAGDELDGSAAGETLNGGPGADLLGGGGGADDMQGGEGDDTMDGGPGPDLIAGGPGVDRATYSASGLPIIASLDGLPGDGAPGEGDNVQPDVENVDSGNGPDTLTGSAAGNELTSGGGEDYADGGAGPDVLQMGAARDVVRARDGVADTLDCGSSSDFAIVDPIDIVAKSCERIDKGRSRTRLGRLVLLRPLKGGEAFGLHGMHRTVPLKDQIGVPLGTKLDSTHGTVRLTAARSGGGTFSGDFSQGAFLVKQGRSERGLIEVALTGGAALSKCPAGGAGAARGAASHRVLRRLFGHARGRFRSRGRFSTATVRGTEWTVIDRCDGTLTTVKQGTVRVRNLVLHRTVTLKSGQRYLARRGNR